MTLARGQICKYNNVHGFKPNKLQLSEKENSCNNLKGEEKWKVKREKYSARV